MIKYYLDTEFIESGPEHPIVLLSIGLVSSDGEEYYAEVKDADTSRASDWIKQNVLTKLAGPVKTREEIARDVAAFFKQGRKELWGYYSAYDMVLMCQLFGRMIDRPTNVPMVCYDLKQLADSRGWRKRDYPKQKDGHHNALADARWNKLLHETVMQEDRSQRPQNDT